MAVARVVQIAPLGRVSRELLAAVAVAVRARFACTPVVLPAMPLPPDAWHPERLQHDADALLEALFDRLPLDVCRIVGVTDADLFADARNYVFGYAHMRDRVAVVSTCRLVSLGQLEKAVVHELGHTFHAPHCHADRCVMR